MLHPIFAAVVRRTFQKKFFLPSIARILSFVFLFTNIFFAHQLQASVWSERKNQIQLASLPSAAPFLKIPATLSPATRLSTPAVSQKFKTRLQNFQTIPNRFFSHVQIRDVSEKGNTAPVILIEDVHMNKDGQTNISAALKSLDAIENGSSMIVGLEGARGGFVYNAYKNLPNTQIADMVADSFLAEGRISGPAHAGFTSRNNRLQFWGVDDPSFYVKNIDAYKKSSLEKPAALKQLAGLSKSLEAEKGSEFSDDLKRFDSVVSGYRKGSVSLSSYIKELASRVESSSLSFDMFAQALEMEQSLDFAKVESERRWVLEKLVGAMNAADTSSLVALSLSYQKGEATFADYYRAIDRLCKKHGVPLQRVSNFESYVKYVLLADGINAGVVFNETASLEDQIYAHLASTEKQKSLINQAKQLYLSEQLINFTLTSDQWRQYQQGGSNSSLDLKTFEAFYVMAELRNEKIVSNILKANQHKPAVLVAGGYHTSGITEIFRKKGVPYLVVSPKISKIEGGSASQYLSVFDREKTPLEHIFSGRRLFLADVPAGAISPLREAPATHRMMSFVVVALAAVKDQTLSLSDATRAALRKLGLSLQPLSLEGTGGEMQIGNEKLVFELIPVGQQRLPKQTMDQVQLSDGSRFQILKKYSSYGVMVVAAGAIAILFSGNTISMRTAIWALLLLATAFLLIRPMMDVDNPSFMDFFSMKHELDLITKLTREQLAREQAIGGLNVWLSYVALFALSRDQMNDRILEIVGDLDHDRTAYPEINLFLARQSLAQIRSMLTLQKSDAAKLDRQTSIDLLTHKYIPKRNFEEATRLLESMGLLETKPRSSSLMEITSEQIEKTRAINEKSANEFAKAFAEKAGKAPTPNVRVSARGGIEIRFDDAVAIFQLAEDHSMHVYVLAADQKEAERLNKLLEQAITEFTSPQPPQGPASTTTAGIIGTVIGSAALWQWFHSAATGHAQASMGSGLIVVLIGGLLYVLVRSVVEHNPFLSNKQYDAMAVRQTPLERVNIWLQCVLMLAHFDKKRLEAIDQLIKKSLNKNVSESSSILDSVIEALDIAKVVPAVDALMEEWKRDRQSPEAQARLEEFTRIMLPEKLHTNAITLLQNMGHLKKPTSPTVVSGIVGSVIGSAALWQLFQSTTGGPAQASVGAAFGVAILVAILYSLTRNIMPGITPIIMGNKKMNETRLEAEAFVQELKKLGIPSNRTVVLFPTASNLETVQREIAGSTMKIGTQNIHYEAKGAFTGESSASILSADGIQYVLIGHSERRTQNQEDNFLLNRKLKAALAAGLIPVLCVGETKEQRQAGAHQFVVEQQLSEGLKDVSRDELEDIIFAYEPVWAIGTGLTATPDDAQQMHALMRREIANHKSRPDATKIPLLYGGSVTDTTVDQLMSQPDIDGVLVGGASLKAASFRRIAAFEAPGHTPEFAAAPAEILSAADKKILLQFIGWMSMVSLRGRSKTETLRVLGKILAPFAGSSKDPAVDLNPSRAVLQSLANVMKEYEANDRLVEERTKELTKEVLPKEAHKEAIQLLKDLGLLNDVNTLRSPSILGIALLSASLPIFGFSLFDSAIVATSLILVLLASWRSVVPANFPFSKKGKVYFYEAGPIKLPLVSRDWHNSYRTLMDMSTAFASHHFTLKQGKKNLIISERHWRDGTKLKMDFKLDDRFILDVRFQITPAHEVEITFTEEHAESDAYMLKLAPQIFDILRQDGFITSEITDPYTKKFMQHLSNPKSKKIDGNIAGGLLGFALLADWFNSSPAVDPQQASLFLAFVVLVALAFIYSVMKVVIPPVRALLPIPDYGSDPIELLTDLLPAHVNRHHIKHSLRSIGIVTITELIKRKRSSLAGKLTEIEIKDLERVMKPLGLWFVPEVENGQTAEESTESLVIRARLRKALGDVNIAKLKDFQNVSMLNLAISLRDGAMPKSRLVDLIAVGDALYAKGLRYLPETDAIELVLARIRWLAGQDNVALERALRHSFRTKGISRVSLMRRLSAEDLSELVHVSKNIVDQIVKITNYYHIPLKKNSGSTVLRSPGVFGTALLFGALSIQGFSVMDLAVIGIGAFAAVWVIKPSRKVTLEGTIFEPLKNKLRRTAVTFHSDHEPIVISASAFNDESDLYAIASSESEFESRIRIYNRLSMQQVRELPVYTGRVNMLEFDSKGNVLLIADHSGVVRLWDLRTKTYIVQLKHNFPVVSAYMGQLPAGLKTIDHHGVMRSWKLKGGQVQIEFSRADGEFTSPMALSPNGFILAVVDNRGQVMLIDLNGKKRTTLNFHSPTELLFDPSGKYLVVASHSQFHIYDVETGHRLSETVTHPREYSSHFAYRTDGRYLAVGTNPIEIFDMADPMSPQLVKKFSLPSNNVQRLIFTSDNKSLVVLSSDGMSVFNLGLETPPALLASFAVLGAGAVAANGWVSDVLSKQFAMGFVAGAAVLGVLWLVTYIINLKHRMRIVLQSHQIQDIVDVLSKRMQQPPAPVQLPAPAPVESQPVVREEAPVRYNLQDNLHGSAIAFSFYRDFTTRNEKPIQAALLKIIQHFYLQQPDERAEATPADFVSSLPNNRRWLMQLTMSRDDSLSILRIDFTDPATHEQLGRVVFAPFKENQLKLALAGFDTYQENMRAAIVTSLAELGIFNIEASYRGDGAPLDLAAFANLGKLEKLPGLIYEVPESGTVTDGDVEEFITDSSLFDDAEEPSSTESEGAMIEELRDAPVAAEPNETSIYGAFEFLPVTPRPKEIVHEPETVDIEALEEINLLELAAEGGAPASIVRLNFMRVFEEEHEVPSYAALERVATLFRKKGSATDINRATFLFTASPLRVRYQTVMKRIVGEGLYISFHEPTKDDVVGVVTVREKGPLALEVSISGFADKPTEFKEALLGYLSQIPQFEYDQPTRSPSENVKLEKIATHTNGGSTKLNSPVMALVLSTLLAMVSSDHPLLSLIVVALAFVGVIATIAKVNHGGDNNKPLVDALTAAGPRGKVIGDSVMAGYVRRAQSETSQTLQQVHQDVLDYYLTRTHTDLSSQLNQLPSQKIEVSVFHLNQLGDPSLLKQELDDLHKLIRRTEDTRDFDATIVVAVHGALPADVEATLVDWMNAHVSILNAVRVTNDMRMGANGAYSYTKLLNKAVRSTAGVRFEAIEALLENKYDSASLRTFSKVPAEFIADGHLTDIWIALANIGLGWTVVPVSTLLKVALLAKKAA